MSFEDVRVSVCWANWPHMRLDGFVGFQIAGGQAPFDDGGVLFGLWLWPRSGRPGNDDELITGVNISPGGNGSSAPQEQPRARL